jgi:hypothetical protein
MALTEGAVSCADAVAAMPSVGTAMATATVRASVWRIETRVRQLITHRADRLTDPATQAPEDDLILAGRERAGLGVEHFR